MNTGERGLLGRPVLIPQAAGTCLGGLISSALAQGWLLGIVPAWDGPSLSLHCVFLGSVSLEFCGSWQHHLTHFAAPSASVWGIRSSGQELLGAELCRIGASVRNMHRVCMGREGGKVLSV